MTHAWVARPIDTAISYQKQRHTMPVELIVPSAGESITEVQIGEWKYKEGDFVEKDAVLVEIETDKVTQELYAETAGTLTQIKTVEGEQATVGDVIGLMEAGEASGASAAPAPATESQPEPASSEGASGGGAASGGGGDSGGLKIMPAAKRLIEENGVDPTQVKATGPGGRILKQDVETYLKTKPTPGSASSEAPAATPSPASAPAPVSGGGGRREEIKPMTPLRRTIAKRLVEAQQTAALLTTFNEVDMSAVMGLRKQYKETFEKQHGVKLGFMSFFVKAVVDALKQFPAINAEIQGTNILYKDYCDIGVAIGGGRGLVVPILRDAESMSFADIEKQIGVFAGKAKENKLTMDELTGGTFTITNGGVFGSLLSTPIINPPQSGVLGMHTIQQRPVVVDGQIVVRPMMYLALTYDHRIVDGREAVQFLVRIKTSIEDPSRMLMEV